MPDIWSTTAELDTATQERLADVLELRGADGQQQAVRRRFLAVGDDDPLQARVDAMIANSVTDRWLVRRLPMLALAATHT